MFSFQHTDDLVFHQNPYTISFQQQTRRNQQDLVVKLHDHVPTTKARKLHGGHSPSSKPSKDEQTQRKLAHREIERQRRRDMAELYASLSCLLPLEFVKEKRSTSDHILQAVNYIKHLQETIEVLSFKRDRLKKFVEAGEKKRLSNLRHNTVSISSCDEGVQILVNSCSIEDGFPLSRVLKAISDEGYNVISCSCTKVNQRLIHSIQTEVNDLVSTDISVLQHKLSAVANSY